MLVTLALHLLPALVYAPDASSSVSLAPAATAVPSTDTDAGTALFEAETIQCKNCARNNGDFVLIVFIHSDG